ncbi:MAG TPA: glycosyl transferase family 1 [Clostridiales bacterium]|jgi:glycosyltransferase involved in cell wall biosynthesis|nr:glycosyl transferase family 1 [Clostridiales bacterium]
MKVLWLCNVLLPKVANHICEKINPSGGWMVGLSDSLSLNDDIELTIVFPLSSSKTIISGEIEGIKYFGFPQKKAVIKYDKQTEIYLSRIVLEAQPDIIHIWGTEYPHTLAMMNVCESRGIIDKVLISIQGLCSIIAQHYFSGLPHRVVTAYTFRDIIRHENIIKQQKNFQIRGKFEVEALKKAKHVEGRTTWDKACVMQINPDIKYYHCPRTLRSSFYENQWSIKNCEKYSIFISQATYPIKGLHFMFEAMPAILNSFPSTKLYVAGNNITSTDTLKARIKQNSYGMYLNRLLKKYHLEDKVFFTGPLDEKRMCDRFLKSHVFVLPSTIENSPNSLGEAMALGLPSVASDVGGVKDMIKHEIDGFIYQHDAPYMLAHYVCEIFENSDLAKQFSINSHNHAMLTHDRQKNEKTMISIYSDICCRNSAGDLWCPPL